MKTIQRNDIKGDSIKSLPSTYRGVTFRSRMEARWAAYFDLLQIEWIYEPEGICLPSGNYCPDFGLKLYGVGQRMDYAEVKPTTEAADFIAPKLSELALAFGGQVFCLIGNPQERQQHRCYGKGKYGEGAFSWLAFVYKEWSTLDFCGPYDLTDGDVATFDLLNRMRFENGVCTEDFRRLAIKR